MAAAAKQIGTRIEERRELERIVRSRTAERRAVERARIVLAAADGANDWLADHPRWRFVFTPKHTSWLNQVEIFFSILTRRLLKRGAFANERALAQQMFAFVETYNQTARPFNWTYTGKVLAA